MLPGEPSLPEAIFAPNGNAVNQLFDALCQSSDRWLVTQFTALYKALQIFWFENHGACCPDCGKNHIIRKGWRPRVLKSSRGRLEFFVMQANCKACNRTFRPFTSLSGLPSSRRFLEELVDKAVELAVQVPFGRSARIIKQLTKGTISHEGVRRQVAKKAKQIVLPTPNQNKTVLVDSTKVKAGNKKRGAPVHLAITAGPGPKVAGRKTIIKQLLHLHVGGVDPLRTRLKELQPQHLVHDGGEDYSGCAVKIQRCNWHLVHQLKHYLWQDGLPFEERDFYQDSLRTILWDAKNGIANFALFAEDLDRFGFKTTANHLKGAESEAFTWVENPGFSYTTTSPLEREMREVNRRADVGARWSEKGIENVLLVRFHKRLNENPLGRSQPR